MSTILHVPRVTHGGDVSTGQNHFIGWWDPCFLSHVVCLLMVEATFLIILDGSYVMIHNDLIYPNVCCFNPFFLVKPPPKPPPNCLGSAPQLRQAPAGSWSAPPAAGRLEPGPRAVWTAGRSRGRWGKRSVESWSIGYQICYVYIYIYYNT